MEMFIYFVGAVTALILTIVYFLYQEMQNVDKTMWNQNNTLKSRISMLENHIAELNKEINTLKAPLEDEQ